MLVKLVVINSPCFQASDLKFNDIVRAKVKPKSNTGEGRTDKQTTGSGRVPVQGAMHHFQCSHHVSHHRLQAQQRNPGNTHNKVNTPQSCLAATLLTMREETTGKKQSLKLVRGVIAPAATENITAIETWWEQLWRRLLALSCCHVFNWWHI